MASFSVSGLVPMSAAIAGSEVAITVESMFSMNRAVATISGIRRCLSIGIGRLEKEAGEGGLYHPAVAQAIAEQRIPPNSCVTFPSGQGAPIRPLETPSCHLISHYAKSA